MEMIEARLQLKHENENKNGNTYHESDKGEKRWRLERKSTKKNRKIIKSGWITLRKRLH
jgi:uncharacterized protein (DUF2249 family)